MIPLLDTLQHLICRDRIGYGWTNGIPALESGDFTLEDWIGVAREILDALSDNEATAIANGTAQVVYGVKLAAGAA